MQWTFRTMGFGTNQDVVAGQLADPIAFSMIRSKMYRPNRCVFVMHFICRLVLFCTARHFEKIDSE
jgi:hypothetical protein